MSPGELCSVKGIGQATAIEIGACFEIARRAARETNEAPVIRTAQDVFTALEPEMRHLDHEEFWVLHLAPSGKILMRQRVSQGGFSAAAIDQRMIFRRHTPWAAKPSSCATTTPPARSPYRPRTSGATQEIHSACRLLGFRLADHVIFVPGGYISLAERGLL